jgi:hypothetical protein
VNLGIAELDDESLNSLSPFFITEELANVELIRAGALWRYTEAIG